MASSRDDFIIAIRSAFLKKSTQQKFSLLTLLFVSVFIIVLSNFNFKAVRYVKIGINELVYRSSFVVSIPENFIKDTFVDISEYTFFFNDYKNKQIELNELRSSYVSNEIIQNENKELKELINDYVSSSDKILAKIIVDHDSPFLKSIIINKGSKDGIKIGTNIFDKAYLVGRVIEVNYKTSRVLLLSDLNSNIPVTIAPENIQAIVTGTGNTYGEIKYIKDGLYEGLMEDSIVYTSGTGAIFKSGSPIGKLKIIEEKLSTKIYVEYYSDFTQLKYVFAEILRKSVIKEKDVTSNEKEKDNPIITKLKILEDELKIVEETNSKFSEENENLKNQINNLNNQLSITNDELSTKNVMIEQFNVDQDELEFLRLNLEYGHKCRKSRKLFKKATGFDTGSEKYKRCVLSKGLQIND